MKSKHQTRPVIRGIVTGLCVMTLSACGTFDGMFGGDDAPPLEGERISVLELEKSLVPDTVSEGGAAINLPQPWKNAFWPHAGGYPSHAMQHLSLPEGELKKVWSADIGDGSTDELPLTAQPVLVDGEIYTLDSEGQLSAFSTQSGKTLWQTNVRNPDEDDDPVIGGGIAYAAGRLYVTNGYDEVLAVQPANGDILWRKSLPAPSRAAPTILDGRLFVSTLDNRLLALDAEDGVLLWDYIGISETAGVIGGASPTATKDIVIPAFTSGELSALRVENGSLAWSENLANFKRIGGLSGISDIRALPVIDGGLVFAISFGGKLVAIDQRTGTRVWQRDISGINTPWVAGNHIFVMSSDNELVALEHSSGIISWVTSLKRDDDDERAVFIGPILAGGRLMIFNSAGIVLEINPANGEIIREWDADSSISISPIVAGEALYILSDSGTLSAYR